MEGGGTEWKRGNGREGEARWRDGEIARAARTVRPETLPLTSSTLQVPHWPPPLQFNSLPGKFGARQRQPCDDFPELRPLIQAQGSRDPRPTSGHIQDERGGSGSETYPSWCSTHRHRRSSCRYAAPRPWGGYERMISIESLSETRGKSCWSSIHSAVYAACAKRAKSVSTITDRRLANGI